MQRMLFALLVTSLGVAGTLEAQRPHTVHTPSRWMIGGHTAAALGTSAGTGDVDDIKTSAGLGAGVQVGYRISQRITAYAGFELAKQGIDVPGLEGDFGLTHLEAGAKLNFPIKNSKVMPYAGAWVGRRSLSTTLEDFVTGEEANLSVSGLAAGASGGIQYFVMPTLALDGGVSVGIGKMGNVKVAGEHQAAPPFNNTTTMRLLFGANWYP